MSSQRVPPLPPSQMTPELKDCNDITEGIFRTVYGPPPGTVFTYGGYAPADTSSQPSLQPELLLYGPNQTFTHAPTLAIPTINVMTQGLSRCKDITPDQREVAILIVAWSFGCNFVRYAHERIGVAEPCSLTRGQVRCLSKGEKPGGIEVEDGEGEEVEQLNAECDLAFDVAMELCHRGGAGAKKGPMSRELWERGVGLVGKTGLSSLVHYIGFYCWMCVAMNAFDCPRPDGEEFL